MIDAAKKNNVTLMVDQSQRRFPAHVKAKEVLDSGIMGKILHVTAMFGHAGPENWSPTGKWFFKKKEARFGAMADLGVHKADLIRHLTGKEVKQVTAIFDTLEKKKTDVEDNFASTLIFDDGTMGSLAASWTVKGLEANYMYLHCANGTLQIAVNPEKPLVAALVNPECQIVFDIPKPPTNEKGGWGLDVAGAFVRAALGMEAPFCPGEEGMKSLAVILACEEAAKTGRAVKVKI
jgi:predicted dehydrogenase